MVSIYRGFWGPSGASSSGPLVAPSLNVPSEDRDPSTPTAPAGKPVALEPEMSLENDKAGCGLELLEELPVERARLTGVRAMICSVRGRQTLKTKNALAGCRESQQDPQHHHHKPISSESAMFAHQFRSPKFFQGANSSKKHHMPEFRRYSLQDLHNSRR